MQQIPVLLITVVLQIILCREIFIPAAFNWHIKLKNLSRFVGEKYYLGKRLARVSAHARPDTVPLSYRKRISTNQREQSSLLIHTFVLTSVKLVVG